MPEASAYRAAQAFLARSLLLAESADALRRFPAGAITPGALLVEDEDAEESQGALRFKPIG